MDYCTSQMIEWKFVCERTPHFGGLLKAPVKAFKNHFKKIVGEVKLTFEELVTTTCQTEVCMNSRPLTYRFLATRMELKPSRLVIS